MKRYIHAASDSESPLKDMVDNAESDFDYIIDGLDKLSRMGLEQEAISIVEELTNVLIPIEQSISNAILD